MKTDEERRLLAAGGITLRDVMLPEDEPADLRMGSLRVVLDPSGSATIVAWDYGIDQELLRCHSLDEAVETVLARWRNDPELAQRVTSALFRAWCDETAAAVEPIRAHLAANPGATVTTQLRPGMVVDRFGNLDGFLLYPAGTPFAERSLPPTAIDPSRHDAGLVMLGVAQPVAVLASLAAPAFGQPGGSVVFKLAETSDTVRDLLARGELQVLRIEDVDHS